eukprot:gene13798-17483_t
MAGSGSDAEEVAGLLARGLGAQQWGGDAAVEFGPEEFLRGLLEQLAGFGHTAAVPPLGRFQAELRHSPPPAERAEAGHHISPAT